MHKKMLRVSRKLWTLSEKDRKKATGAFEFLWQGQCNCPYWHGVFGGLYLSHLRDAIYSSLIKAESEADQMLGTRFPRLEMADIALFGRVANTLFSVASRETRKLLCPPGKTLLNFSVSFLFSSILSILVSFA